MCDSQVNLVHYKLPPTCSNCFNSFVTSETVRRPSRGTEPLPQHPPTIELRHRSRSPHHPTTKRSPPEPSHPRPANEDHLHTFSQLPDSNHHLPEEMYPLSVSPAAPNGRCSTPREAPCPGSPGGPEAGPPRVIQLMPSTIMNPLLLSPNRTSGGAAMDFRHSRGGTPAQVTLENGREGKVHSHQHHMPLAQQQQQHLLQQQQEEALYRNHVIMPVSPPEEQQIPIGRIAGKIENSQGHQLCCTFGYLQHKTSRASFCLMSCRPVVIFRLQAAVGLRLPAPVRQQVRELYPLGGYREQSLPHHGPQRPGQALGQSQGEHTLSKLTIVFAPNSRRT